MRDQPNPPIINVPPATGAIALALIAVHVVRSFLDPVQDGFVISVLALVSARFYDGIELSDLVSLIGYMGLFQGWIDFGISLAFLVAVGTGVERSFGARRVLALFLAGGVLSGIAFVLIAGKSLIATFGPAGGTGALIGMLVFLMVARGGNRSKILGISLFWIGMTLSISLLAGGLGNLLWVTPLVGYFIGLGYGLWLTRQSFRS